MSVWVSMIDTFMSGWGDARGRKNVLVLECADMEEAERVREYAETRPEMRCVRVHEEEPYFPSSEYFVSWKGRDEYPMWRS